MFCRLHCTALFASFLNSFIARSTPRCFTESSHRLLSTVCLPHKRLTLCFPGIYGVGKAALHPPALAVLSHTPDGATQTIAWVGKGIVYDTGGLSIKGKVVDTCSAAAFAYMLVPDGNNSVNGCRKPKYVYLSEPLIYCHPYVPSQGKRPNGSFTEQLNSYLIFCP